METELELDEEFKVICRQIVLENNTVDQWREIESCDAFQSAHYCGGYDADEDAFCFSYSDTENQEWWFQLTLNEIEYILQNTVTRIQIRRPDEF